MHAQSGRNNKAGLTLKDETSTQFGVPTEQRSQTHIKAACGIHKAS